MCHSKQLIEVSIMHPMPNDSAVAKSFEQAVNTEACVRLASTGQASTSLGPGASHPTTVAAQQNPQRGAVK